MHTRDMTTTSTYGSCFRYQDHCEACQSWAAYAAELTAAMVKPVQMLQATTGNVVHIASGPDALTSICAPFGRMGARPMVLRRSKFTTATCKTCLKH